MTSSISIQNLNKRFGSTPVYKDLNLEIEEGKITSIFGPNGSGKSTLFNILSGITDKDGGDYSIRNFNHFEFSYIFQNYRESLLPWRTNFENVAFPLELQGKDKEYIGTKIKELQKIFEFDFDWDGHPYQLSGGQQQILAFMRALITSPKILFVDEPFSSLDYENNLKLRKHLQAYYMAYKPTIVLITHNIEEAVHLSHWIIIFGDRPTSVVASIENRAPFPRGIKTLESEEFYRVRDRVLEAFCTTTQL